MNGVSSPALRSARTIAGDDIYFQIALTKPIGEITVNSLIGVNLTLFIESVTGTNLAQLSTADGNTAAGSIVKTAETISTISAIAILSRSVSQLFAVDRKYHFVLKAALPSGQVLTPDGSTGNFRMLANPALDAAISPTTPAIPFQVLQVSSDLTITAVPGSALVCVVDATQGSITITLPPAALSKEMAVQIKKVDSTNHPVIVSCSGSDKLDGAVSQTISAQYDALDLLPSTSNSWGIF